MSTTLDDDPLGPNQTAFLRELQHNTLDALLKMLSVIAPLVTLGVLLRESVTPLFLVSGALTLIIWLALVMLSRGRVRPAAQLVVAAILLAGLGGALAQGSVRSGGVLIMLAGVVSAGAFLPRRQVLIVVLLCVAALGILNALDAGGHLQPRNLQAGWALWVTQTGVLLSIMISVFFGRIRTRDAFTEREQALATAEKVTQELRRSQRRFMALFHDNPVATLVQNKTSRRILDLNPAFEQLFGYPRDALLGQTANHLWAQPEAQAEFRDTLEREQQTQHLKGQGRRADGSLIDVMLYAEIISEGDDELVISMVLDISEQERARRALTTSEERFSKAFHFSPIGMTITRLSDGKFVEVNAANERVLGYSAEDFRDKTAEEAGVWVDHADRDRYISELRAHGRLNGHETRMRTKSGEVVPVRIWSEIIELDGQTCSLAFTLNVAEEKSREAVLLNVAKGVSGETGAAFFHSMAQHLAQAVAADGVIAIQVDTASDRSRALAALWQGEEQRLDELPLQGGACGQTLRQTGLLVLNATMAGQLGLTLPFQVNGARLYAGLPLQDADGTPMGLLAVLWTHTQEPDANTRALLSIFASRCSAELVRLRREEDIRQLNTTLEQRVRQRTAQLEYLNRELDTFAYTVSHDLKAPLRAIDGFSHLLREQLADKLAPDDAELFERVDVSVQRMGRLINDLLALARVSQGTLQRMDTDLSEVAASVVRQEQHRAPGRQVEVHIAPGLHADCDPRLAQIVFENLIGNAWKYTRLRTPAIIEIGPSPARP